MTDAWTVRSEITSEQAAVASALISATMGLEGESVGWAYDHREGDVAETELPLDLPIALEDASVVAVDLLGDVEFVPGTKFTARQRAELSFNGSMSLTEYYELNRRWTSSTGRKSTTSTQKFRQRGALL